MDQNISGQPVLRALIAARLSRKLKNGEQGIGIDTQDNRSRGFCERLGYQVVDVVADIRSGTVAPQDRPNLRAWVTEPDKIALYDAIVAYKTDRLSRGEAADFSRIETWAADHGKTLIIVNDMDGIHFPPRGDSDYWQWAATKREARREWENIQERSMRARAELKQRGHLVGRAPFGYEIAGEKYSKMLVPSALGRRLVPEVYSRCIGGDSCADIARWLETQTGYAWWARTVQTLIRNTVYKGFQSDARGNRILDCEYLVEPRVWKQAQQALESRQRGQHQRGPVVDGRALLAGVLFCPRCEGPMYRITCGSGSQVRTQYYRCAGKGPERKGCGNMVRLAELDDIVHFFISHLGRKVTATRKIEGQNWENEIEDVKDRLRQLDPDADDYDERHAALRSLLADLKGRPVTQDRVEEYETEVTYAARWKAQSDAERTAWLKSTGLTVWASRAGQGGIEADLKDRNGNSVQPREFAA